MEVGEYYEIAKEQTSQEVLTKIGKMGSGIGPNNMSTFAVYVGDGKLQVKATLPEDTVIDGNLLCTVKGAKILINADHAPENEDDGELLYNLLRAEGTKTIEKTGLTNDKVYYLAAFPYSDQDVYNRNAENQRTGTPKAYILYGFKIEKNNSNPATRVTYTEMAAGKTPASMNFTAGSFDYGDWADAWFVSGNVPYMVKSNGQLDYELDHSNQTLKKAGGASDVSNASYDGNAMSLFPLVWFKRWEDTDFEYVNICNIQLDNDYHAYAHQRADGTVADYKLLPMFKGSLLNSKLRSLADKAPMVSTTATQETAYATNNGANWYIFSYSEWNMVKDLLTLISKSDNGQTAFGYGCGGASAAQNTGTLKTKGQFFGYSQAQSTVNSVKVFYLEDWWGNVWSRCAGLINANGAIKYKLTRPYNFDGAGYTSAGVTPSGTNGGCISKDKMTDCGRIPYVASGSETTYTPDGLWFNNGQVDYALVGGGWDCAGLLGPSCVNLYNAASNSHTGVGASLSCEQPSA